MTINSTNRNTKGLGKMSKDKLDESVRAFETAIIKLGGKPIPIFDRFRTDSSYADRMAKFALRGGIENPIDHKLARFILGNNFFGFEEWMALYGVKFSKNQLRRFANFPWNVDTLNSPCRFVRGKKIKHTHFAFFGPDKINSKLLSIMKFLELHPGPDHPRFCSESENNDILLYEKEVFAAVTTCSPRWYLMPIEIVPNSTGNIYKEQIKRLSREYEVPVAIEEILKLVLYFRKNNIYPNQEKWARCRDIASDSYNVIVGSTDGIDVRTYCGDHRPAIGIAASRKYPKSI